MSNENNKEAFAEYLRQRESTRRVMTEDGVPEEMQALFFEGKEFFERFVLWCRANKREGLADNLEMMSTDFSNEVCNFGDS